MHDDRFGYAHALLGAERGTAKRNGAAPPTSQGKQTLGAVLLAAGEIASKEGLEQLSMRRLARAVRMSKSGLYAHFSSKEELQLATIEHFFEVFEREVLRGPPDVPDAGLGALLERWLAFYEREVFPGGCFVIVSAVEFASRPGPVRNALESAVDRETAALETAIRRANETGELRPKQDPSQTAFELASILASANALFKVKRDPAAFDRARVAIRRLLGEVDGLANPGTDLRTVTP